MIARVWKARATPARARDYDAYFARTVQPELDALAGFERATILHERRGDAVEIAVITWWSSLDAIRSFAGDSLTTAVVHDEAAALLIDFDGRVTHHDVTYDRAAAR
ncbi:MAG TPA: hypothetical protein VFB07_07390 [Vicinamibacterales bacterium]|nr:hypothetical protein [Vicinamibacterales bacterium]